MKTKRHDSDDVADVNQMHLAALIFDWRVDAHVAAVWTESRMRIDPPFAGINLGKRKLAEVDSLPVGKVIQVRRLQAVWPLRVGVIQKPLIAGQVR